MGERNAMTGTDPSNITCDLCIIGAGSGGLSVAAAAAQMAARVVLVEAGAMGGDCLNTGCMPSKAMIAAAQAAHGGEGAPDLGIAAATPRIEFAAVHAHVRRVIAAIAPHDSVERFESLGVQVVKAEARFTAPDEIIAGTQRIKARRFVIAAGSRAALPPIPGLAEAGAYTNETIFDLTERPEHLVVIGGGPIGLELSQAFRRLGSAVTVLERHVILPRDEPEAAELVRHRLRGEGVDLRESIQIDSVRRDAAGVTVGIEDNDGKRSIAGTHLLVAAGRQPNVERLGLEAAGIVFTPKGITVDAGLRTSNRKVYAIGDIAGGPQFTHIAGYHAGLVIRSALLGLPAKVDYAALPWVTFLDPEIAHVGLTEAEARKQHGSVTVLHESFARNDRAVTEQETEGFIKVIAGPRGRILGATIVGPHAGEMISLWGLAISRRLKLSAIAGMLAPYPTLSEISKRAAGQYYAPLVFGSKVRALVRLVQKFLP
jgi:pyruvate/2-oxoglutarate dehydrogenase complex dihydrolipoamide dehydrogenase (E3) component